MIIFVCGSMVVVLLLPTGQRAGSGSRIGVTVDRADAIYSVGDTATFLIKTTKHLGEATYRFSLDGAAELGRGTVEMQRSDPAGGRASVKGTLGKPGVLRCMVSFDSKNRDKHVVGAGMAAAAFEPLNIQPTAVKPDDFETFWRGQMEALAGLASNPRVVPINPPGEKVDLYKIALNHFDGARIHGYLAKPHGDGPFPAILRLPEAGVKSVGPATEVRHAKDGFLAMCINAHDLDNELPAARYLKLSKGELRDYQVRGREDRATYYFRNVFLSCIRAVDYLASRPDWDGQHMIVQGSSQGGAMALVTAALDPRVTAVVAFAPAMCDHSGVAFNRPSGWPRLVPRNENGKPDVNILKVSAYYDAVNFARMITVPVLFGVGLADTTCPPTTIFAAYNVLAGPKQIDISPRTGHQRNASYDDVKKRWILQQAGLAE